MKSFNLKFEEQLYTNLDKITDNKSEFIRQAIYEKINGRQEKSPSLRHDVKSLIDEMSSIKELQIELNINQENLKTDIFDEVKKAINIIPQLNNVIASLREKIQQIEEKLNRIMK